MITKRLFFIVVFACCVNQIISFNSSAATFNTVIDIPPDSLPDDTVIGNNTQINLGDGGAIGGFVRLGQDNVLNTDIELNMTGGSLPGGLFANAGSTLNVSGGQARNLNLRPGSTTSITGGFINAVTGIGNNQFGDVNATISGGVIGNLVAGSEYEIIGNDFKLDGQPFTGSMLSLNLNNNPNSVLTGTLVDGSVLIVSRLSGDGLTNTRFTTTPVNPPDLTPIVIDDPGDFIPRGLRSGQTMTVEDGGEVYNNFSAVDASITINGGRIRDSLRIVNTSLTVNGGVVEQFSESFAGSVVEVNAGIVANAFKVFNGSTFNLNNGRVNSIFVEAGGQMNMTGGVVKNQFAIEDGGTATISAGTLGYSFNAKAGSQTEIIGGEFLLNGVNVGNSTVTLSGSDVLSGTLTDGSGFIISPLANDVAQSVQFTIAPLPIADLNLIVINGSSPPAPQGLRPGQSLRLEEGGTLPAHFAVANATLDIMGGVVEENLEISNSHVRISGGNITGVFGSQMDVYDGSTVDIEGGIVRGAIDIFTGAEMNISGGQVGRFDDGTAGALRIYDNGVVNITGGAVGDRLTILDGGQVNISGGMISDRFFKADENGEVHFFGESFLIDGVPLTDLLINEAKLITERDVNLSGILADGLAFSIDLNSTSIGDEAVFDLNSTVTVTLIPEPGTLTLFLCGMACTLRRR